MRRTRVIGLTLLALAVPPFALGGEETPAGPQALQVSASLGGCGLADAAIVCGIETSWNAIEGADSYAVTVTRPDGSVLDLGQSSGTGRTLFVPYVGSGNYSIQVAAWGTPPGEEDPQVLARDRATSSGDAERGTSHRTSARPVDEGPAGEDRSHADPGSDVIPEQPAREEVPSGEAPDCSEPESGQETSGDDAADQAVAAVTAEALSEQPVAEQYDPGDADGDGGCPLSTSP